MAPAAPALTRGGIVRGTLVALSALVLATALAFWAIQLYEERGLSPRGEPGEFEPLETNAALLTPNTTRIGSDDPVETAVAVSQTVYPATEEENTPGAVVLVNRTSLAEVMAAASRVQHFPVNAPLLYVDDGGLPEATRSELLRLMPEGVAQDGNVQVYLVGTLPEGVAREVTGMGFRARALTAPDPIALTEVLDDWTATQHGDHRNAIAVANLDNLEPAIPAAFWNAHEGDGFVFVTDEGVPEATQRILQRTYSGPWIYVFGDESVVPERVARELAQFGHVTRVPAPDPAGVSALFAAFHDVGRDWGGWIFQQDRSFGWDIGEAGHNAIFVNLNGPRGWQNALVATTLSHMGKHAPVLVVERDTVPEPVARHLLATRPYATAPRQQLLNHGLIIGGPETIGYDVQVELDALLEGVALPEGAEGG